MRFVKMHGLGNDFVVLDGTVERVAQDPHRLARQICDRHTGVGADGLLLILPGEEGVDADLRMRVYNADGGEPEMCGNGIRCVCKFAHDRGLSRKNPMRIQTGRGVLALSYTLDGSGLVDSVTVDMGEPILDAAKIPVRLMLGKEECGLDERLTCVSMGNPHAIFYCRDVAAVPLDRLGPFVERHPIFPSGTNVHFVQVIGPSEVKMRTWERGSGITLACGTGAAAVCVAGVLTGRTGRRLRAHLPGGDLVLEWRESDHRVSMTGPAVSVFTGEWPD